MLQTRLAKRRGGDKVSKTTLISWKGHMLSMLNDRKTSSTVASQIVVNCLEESASFACACLVWASIFIIIHTLRAVVLLKLTSSSCTRSVGTVSWHLHTSTMPAYSSHRQLITDTSPLRLAQLMAILQPAPSVFLSVCNYLATLSLHIYLVEEGQA